MLITLLALAGCGGRLQPATTAQLAPGGGKTAVLTVDGVTVMARANAWRGEHQPKDSLCILNFAARDPFERFGHRQSHHVEDLVVVQSLLAFGELGREVHPHLLFAEAGRDEELRQLFEMSGHNAELLFQLTRSADFGSFIARIRQDYGRRPSLMKALAAKGL